MRNFTSSAIALIVCLYISLGSLYVFNKDYTGEEVEVSTLVANGDSSVVSVYVPKYMVHLKVPKSEWSGENKFVLQKDYGFVANSFLGFMGFVLMVVSAICAAIFLFLYGLGEIEIYE